MYIYIYIYISLYIYIYVYIYIYILHWEKRRAATSLLSEIGRKAPQSPARPAPRTGDRLLSSSCGLFRYCIKIIQICISDNSPEIDFFPRGRRRVPAPAQGRPPRSAEDPGPRQEHAYIYISLSLYIYIYSVFLLYTTWYTVFLSWRSRPEKRARWKTVERKQGDSNVRNIEHSNRQSNTVQQELKI